MRSYTDIAYTDTPAGPMLLDLRIPEARTAPPLVLYIPMGGMRTCLRPHAQWWLTEHGFAMASIEARTSSQGLAPAAVHDCKSAVRWLRANAPAYGYDGSRIGAWGRSAGGLLAALIGTSGDEPALEGDGPCRGVSSAVQAVVDFCGSPHDFQHFADPRVQAQFPVVRENLRLYLGGYVEDRPELARLVSPRTYVSPRNPPMLLVHGDTDTVSPPDDTVAFHRALLQAGVDSTLRVLPGVGHGWEPQVTAEDVVAFFRRHLGGMHQ
jgi:acetyl esterase/lipase